MGNTVPRDLRTWGDEFGTFARRWWWTLAVIFFMTWLPPVPAVQVAFNWAIFALVVLVATWAIVTARRMPRQRDEKWRRDVGRSIHGSWVAVAIRLGLGVPDYATRGTVPPAISYPTWDGWTCILRVSLPQGLGREHLVSILQSWDFEPVYRTRGLADDWESRPNSFEAAEYAFIFDLIDEDDYRLLLQRAARTKDY